MSINVRRAAVFAALVLPLGAFAQETIVKIGHVAPTSGSIAHLGKDNEMSARMAIEDLNAKGLMIGGKKVTFALLAEDDGADPKQATAVAQKLVDSGVNGVVGHLNSGTSIPASRIYSDAGIAQISPAATNPKFTRQGYKTTFRVVADDVQLGGALGCNWAAPWADTPSTRSTAPPSPSSMTALPTARAWLKSLKKALSQPAARWLRASSPPTRPRISPPS